MKVRTIVEALAAGVGITAIVTMGKLGDFTPGLDTPAAMATVRDAIIPGHFDKDSNWVPSDTLYGGGHNLQINIRDLDGMGSGRLDPGDSIWGAIYLRKVGEDTARLQVFGYSPDSATYPTGGRTLMYQGGLQFFVR